MTLEQARRNIVAGLHKAAGVLYEERFASRLEDSKQDVHFAELELDSLSTMAALIEITEETGVEIDLGDLALHPSINSLASFVASRAAAK